MGVQFLAMKSYHEYGDSLPLQSQEREVLSLAVKVITPLIALKVTPKISHLIVATTCPDSIAPSVGQEINQTFHPYFSNTHVIDIMQGCSGGITALLLGSQLALLNNTTVMVVTVDAARKACDSTSHNFDVFGNGSFGCIIGVSEDNKGLLHYKSRQYKDLVNVVNVRLGHDADQVLAQHADVNLNPRKYLGLIMNNALAVQLLRNAESFYHEFISEINCTPDIMILHQVNSKIIGFLKVLFEARGVHFVNISQQTGNCGAASVGIALAHSTQMTDGKKVLICSFGTGGVITAGLWQF